MNVSPIHISYHPQRSSTARIKNGEIFLRISTFATHSEQQNHIENLLRKIKRSIPKSIPKKKISLIPSLESGILKLNTDTTYYLQLKYSNRKSISFQKTGERLFILIPINSNHSNETAFTPKLQKQIEKLLWKFLCKDQVKPLTEKLLHIQHSTLNGSKIPWLTESFKNLTLKTTTSRWGSCNKRTKTIMLSVKLLLVEEELLNYVCVHELAHLKHSNHSALFWNLVSQKLPEWKILCKKLNRYHDEE